MMSLSEEVALLEKKLEMAHETVDELTFKKRMLQKQVEFLEKMCSMITPVKVYYHEGRKNTTVTFRDGKSATVHLMDGDKHDLKEAVIQCLVKKLIKPEHLKKLIKEAEIIKEER